MPTLGEGKFVDVYGSQQKLDKCTRNRVMRGKMRHLRTFIVVEWKAQQFEISF
jgi:hypothetical protein